MELMPCCPSIISLLRGFWRLTSPYGVVARRTSTMRCLRIDTATASAGRVHLARSTATNLVAHSRGRPRITRRSVCKAAGGSRDQPQHHESLDEEWMRMRPLPLRQLDLELDEAWASRSRGDAADSRASPAESINSSSSSSSSGHESTAEGEHLGFTAWPTEDGGLASFSYSLDLEWPEHLQSALYPRATVPSWKDLNQVFVILFGVGTSETEGIYSLRALSGDDGLPQDTIIAFECEDDAVRYASLLEATMEHAPSVTAIEPAELMEFCAEAGYTYRLESHGSLLIPPDYNVGMTDWERSMRLRGGHWSVSEDSKIASPSSSAQRAPPGAGGPLPMLHNNVGYYPGDTLEEMRSRLERCLAPPSEPQ